MKREELHLPAKKLQRDTHRQLVSVRWLNAPSRVRHELGDRPWTVGHGMASRLSIYHDRQGNWCHRSTIYNLKSESEIRYKMVTLIGGVAIVAIVAPRKWRGCAADWQSTYSDPEYHTAMRVVEGCN